MRVSGPMLFQLSCRRRSGQGDCTSSVQTLKLTSVLAPNVVLIATSIASRPLAISTRPIRGTLLRGSKVYQRPPRYASNQAAKSIGPQGGGNHVLPGETGAKRPGEVMWPP